MKKLILIMLGVVFLGGCSSLNINPITAKQAKDAHKENNNIEGYIVYAPEVYVSVTNLEKECKISTLLMPNTERPFSVDIKEGLGKINATINITDGWMLGTVSANIDNTSVLGNLEKFLLMAENKEKPEPIPDNTQYICGMKNGIYSLEKIQGKNWKLQQVIIGN